MANQVKYYVEYLSIRMVLGTLVYVIIIIIAIIIIIFLLQFLFQLFFVTPIGTDYYAELSNAKEFQLPINS
jgi:hypothetical protein